MKLIIAGGRYYRFTSYDIDRLDDLRSKNLINEVVSGGASGADACGEEWAKERGIPVKRFPADWNKFGKAAGPIRNAQMADYANDVVLFPGGKGTDSMRKLAKLAGLVIHDFTK